MKDIDYPALHQSASDISKESQDAFFLVFFGHMAMLTLATAISIYNSAEPGWAIIQAMVLFGALACAIHLYLVRPDRDWYAGRAVAESVKTITWRYITKAEPFDNSDAIDANNFSQRLKFIVNENRQISGKLISKLAEKQISDEMIRVRSESLTARQEYYRDHRIMDQLHWYAKKAAYNTKMVKRYFRTLLVVLGTAIVFAIAKIRFPDISYWPTDLFVTLAAALLSWIQAKRFQDLSVSYALTAHEIGIIRQRTAFAMNTKDFSDFVGDAENAFSREHTQWIARQDQ